MFRYEDELVSKFINFLYDESNNIVVKEMDTRHGNIDIVTIKSNGFIFNKNQTSILSKPGNSMVFSYLKNSRFLSYKSIISNVGLSESSVNYCLYELKKGNLVTENDGLYRRSKKFIFPKTEITGYEAKLKNFQKAYYQAVKNIKYVDYSYIVFPMTKARRINEKYKDYLKESKIGLIGVDKERYYIFIKAFKPHVITESMRLLNVSKSYDLLYKESNKVRFYTDGR